MPENEPAPEWVTLFNPVNGLPWQAPNKPDVLDYYVGEKKFTKTPNSKTPAEAKAAAKEDSANG